MLRALWRALTEPRTDPRALACPLCGRHRFKRLEYPIGFVRCGFCKEELPVEELVLRWTEEAQRNYRERTYGSPISEH